jgi:RNA polymerase sigma factor (sigma-70 family)
MSTPMPIDPERIRDALAGDRKAIRDLLAVAQPIVRARIASALARRRARPGAMTHDLDDLTQEVFAALFDDGGRALRGWDPLLGLSFGNFVGLLTQRRVASIMRRSASLPPHELAGSESDVPHELASHETTPENDVASRELLGTLCAAMRRALSRRGLALFEHLYLRDLSIEEVCEDMDMTCYAVYQWRRRLALLARSELTNLEREVALVA